MTQQELENELTIYSESLGLSGIISTSIIKLLAYSLYIDNSNLNSKVLNSVFSASTTLNNRITHAVQLLYSVYRGKNTSVRYNNILAGRSTTYKYLDPAFQYNGIYYYYANDYDTTAGANYNIEYISSDKIIMEYTVTDINSNYQYIDFPVANVSEDLVLYGSNAAQSDEILTWTSDAYEFMKNEKLNDDTYKYQYLLITNINYGVRLIKRYEENNLEGNWRYTSYKIKYIPYNEFLPDLTELRSLGDFEYVERVDRGSINELYTELIVNKFTSRMENLESIYTNATKYFMSRNQIGSITDIEYIIESKDKSQLLIYNITNKTNSSEEFIGYIIYVDANESIRNEIKSEIESRNPPFSVEISQMEAKSINITYTSEDDYYTEVELNEHFRDVWKRSRNLTLAEIQAQILRYDSSMVYCTLNASSNFTLSPNQYYNITLIKGN